MMRPTQLTKQISILLPFAFVLSCSQAGNVPSMTLDDSFTKAKVLPQPRYGMTAVNVAGNIYLIGGSGMKGIIPNIDRYDHSAGTLTTLTTSLMPRRYHTAEATGNDIFVISGLTEVLVSQGRGLFLTNSVEAYDVGSGQVRAVSPIPAARRLAGSAIYNGKIYVMGGSVYRTTAARSQYYDNVQIYDIATDRWSIGQRMPTARECKVTQWEGKIYAAGGFNGQALSAFEVYDIETDSWEVYPDVPFRASAYSCAALGGKLYFFGDYFDMKRVARYDIATGKWTVLKTNFSGSRHTAASALDDQIVVAGGIYSSSGAGYRYIQTFSPPRSRGE